MTRVFLTHLHNNHIEGLSTLWLTPWFLLGRQSPLELWGPPGTASMIDGTRRMYAHDLENRPNSVLTRESFDIAVHEIAIPSGSAVIYNVSGTKVTAFPIEHADGDPPLGYRVDAAQRSVLLSGDTTYRENVAAVAKGVDVIVSNIAAATSEMERAAALAPILGKRMRPERRRLCSAPRPRAWLSTRMW